MVVSFREVVFASGLLVAAFPATAWSEDDQQEGPQQEPAVNETATDDEQAESAAGAAAGGPTWPVPKFGVSASIPPEVEFPDDLPLEVLLTIVIGEDGVVIDAVVLDGCGVEEVDAVALRTMKLMRFLPSTLDGVPATVTIDYPMVFLPPAAAEPELMASRLSGRVEVKGSREPVGLAEVALFVATPKPEEGKPEEDKGKEDKEKEDKEKEDKGKEDKEKEDKEKEDKDVEPPNWEDFILADKAILTVTTDDDGRFDFAEVPPGTYVAALGSGGFKLERFVEIFAEGEERDVIYRILPTGLPETIVVARSSSDIPERVLTRQQLKKMPGAGRDPMAAIISLPGVIHTPPQFGAGDQAQAPVLRGASAEDSVLYLDGLPVPIIFHSLSNFSVTGDDLVDRAYLRPAAVDARYGDLTGGVVGLDLRSPRSDRVGGFLDPGIGLTALALEGPITKNSRFYMGIRRSYFDVFMRLIIPSDAPIDFATFPFFQDQQILLELDPAPWLRLTLGYIGTIDGLELLDAEPDEDDPDPLIFKMRTDMNRIYVRADMKSSWGLTNRVHPAITFWGNEFQFTDAFQSTDRHTTFHLFDDLHVPIRKWLSVDAGASLEVDRLRQYRNSPIGIREDTGPRSSIGGEDNLVGSEVDTRTWVGGYLSLPFKPVPQLTLVPEFRIDWFSSIGKFVPQLRARIGIKPHERVRISIAGGNFAQAPSPEELSRISGNPDLGPETAWHVNAGIKWAPAKWLDLDVQGYLKTLQDQTVSSIEAASFAGFADFEGLLPADQEDPTHGLSNSGVGRIYGMEVFARFGLLHRVGITGWLGYSLSWAERKDFPDEEFRWFQHDRRHQLTALLQLALPGEVTLGARFQFQSGAPKTPVADSVFYADLGQFIPVYGGLYTARSQPYHQLDIRIDKIFRKDKHTIDMYIDVQNVYAAKYSDFDITSYDYREEFTFFTPPIVNFAIRVEF